MRKRLHRILASLAFDQEKLIEAQLLYFAVVALLLASSYFAFGNKTV